MLGTWIPSNLLYFWFLQPAIQSENSEDVTYSEELTSTQQKYVPVFGKPSKSTQKSQPDGNVENTAKRPRKENSQLEEDPKLGSVIEEEEVWESNFFFVL